MHIVVCVKQVPNTTQVRINPETNTLIREGVESIMNPFDENALEMALQIKDKNPSAKVTVVTMGPPQAEAILRDAIALGADDVVLLSDRAFAGSDTWATSYALAQLIRKLGPTPELVLFGKQAIDGDTAQVGPGVAEWIEIPAVTYVRKLEIEGNTAHIERLFEDGFEKIAVPLPCSLSVLKEANVPRMASLKGRMRAKKAEIRKMTAADVQAEEAKIGLQGSPTRVVKIFTPPAKVGGVKIDGTDATAAARQVVEILRERKIV